MFFQRRSRKFFCTILAGAISTMVISSAKAIVTGGAADSSDGTAVTGFGNVGSLSNSSAVYIGGGWVLTAGHVGAGNVTFSTGIFSPDSPTTTLKNPDTTDSDLILFHVGGNVGLPSLTLNTNATPLTADQSFTMIGNGFGRADPEIFYNVDSSTDPDTWTPTPGPTADKGGFAYGSAGTKRFGNNTVESLDAQNHVLEFGPNSANVSSVFFVSDFYDDLAQYNASDKTGVGEGEAADFDSGGAAISGNVLIGIIDAKGAFDGQPANTAIFGDQSIFMDIATYEPQIEAIVSPEPATLGLIGAAMVLLQIRRRCGEEK